MTPAKHLEQFPLGTTGAGPVLGFPLHNHPTVGCCPRKGSAQSQAILQRRAAMCTERTLLAGKLEQLVIGETMSLCTLDQGGPMHTPSCCLNTGFGKDLLAHSHISGLWQEFESPVKGKFLSSFRSIVIIQYLLCSGLSSRHYIFTSVWKAEGEEGLP